MPGSAQTVRAARIRAELIDRLAEVVREVRRSAVRAAGSPPKSPQLRTAAAGLSLAITPGQCADCTQFEPVMDKIRVPRLTCGRARTRPDSVSADKGYSNRRTCRCLRRREIRHVIPEEADQAANRVRRGRAGGWPPGFDKGRHKKCNTVERAINKLKAFRAVATRFDKRGYVYLGTVTAVALIVWPHS
ncbi:transposase [Streptomyces sp. NPDC004111]|uniref:transposase n=1 Tax=Streptomyces sp. NPDC004111 TaxID=3364690 RepID=UPI0036744822